MSLMFVSVKNIDQDCFGGKPRVEGIREGLAKLGIFPVGTNGGATAAM